MPRPAKERVFVTQGLELEIRRGYRLSPSNPSPWFGSWAPGARYTFQQLAALSARGIAESDAENLDVIVCTTAAQLWVPMEQPRPWRRVACPIVGRRLDGRLKVVAPNGERKLVYADGLLRRPFGKAAA